jgi:hypothetical protein
MNARSQFFTDKQIKAAIAGAKGDRDDAFGRLSDRAAAVVIDWQMREINQGTSLGETLDATAELAGWLIANVAKTAAANGMALSTIETASAVAYAHASQFRDLAVGKVHAATQGGSA